MTAEERIVRLIRPEYAERVPSFARRHATECVCRLIARDYPELFGTFSGEAEPRRDDIQRMAGLVNALFAERMKRRQKARGLTKH